LSRICGPNQLVDGEPHFTLLQVALSDAIMVVAFALIVCLLLGLSSISAPGDTLVLSPRSSIRRSVRHRAALARFDASVRRWRTHSNSLARFR
jgi:hypothetical protein